MKLLRPQVATLLASVFIIAICGILYELLISTLTSYFQGSSVTHFSIVIGLFLSSMGVGSFLSKKIHNNLPAWFVRFEVGLSLVGGLSAIILYFAFSLTPYFYITTFMLIVILGTMIGIEIPILTRIINQHDNIKDALANVLSFDYLGALVASLAFPLLLLPTLGTMRTAFVVGLINLSVAFINTLLFKKELKQFRAFIVAEILVGIVLILGFVYSFQINNYFDEKLYRDQVMYSQQSKYQKLVMTRWNDDLRLYINGNLQFSSRDEYRYHEALVHIPMNMTRTHENVLVLGGGDGLAVREILSYKDVKRIDLVDLDPAVTQLGEQHPVLRRLNKSSLASPKVHIHNMDAFNFVEKSNRHYNVIIIDLPDPSNESLGKLYSKAFYQIIQKTLARDGVVVSQSTSPYFAPDAFWCIHHTMQSVFPHTLAYKSYVPTFGMWGYNVGMNHAAPSISELGERLSQRADLQYLQPNMLEGLFQFPKDVIRKDTIINQLDNQPLIRLYEKNWDAMQ